jgi:hypothetical protein
MRNPGRLSLYMVLPRFTSPIAWAVVTKVQECDPQYAQKMPKA